MAFVNKDIGPFSGPPNHKKGVRFVVGHSYVTFSSNTHTHIFIHSTH
jgi:hypothetical protein